MAIHTMVPRTARHRRATMKRNTTMRKNLTLAATVAAALILSGCAADGTLA